MNIVNEWWKNAIEVLDKAECEISDTLMGRNLWNTVNDSVIRALNNGECAL